jgi:hypothetical protein
MKSSSDQLPTLGFATVRNFNQVFIQPHTQHTHMRLTAVTVTCHAHRHTTPQLAKAPALRFTLHLNQNSVQQQPTAAASPPEAQLRVSSVAAASSSAAPRPSEHHALQAVSLHQHK